MAKRTKAYRELAQLLASIENTREASLLMEDLFTPQELEILMERWQIIQALAEGKTQRKIAEELNTSIATVTRGSTTLKYGAKGFAYFLRKLKVI